MPKKRKWKILNNYYAEKYIKIIIRDYHKTEDEARKIIKKIDEEQYIKFQEGIKRLEKSLSTSQSEGTELSFKVPSQSSDKSCPKHQRRLSENGYCQDCGDFPIQK